MQTARGIENHHVKAVLPGILIGALRDIHRLLVLAHGKDLDALLLAVYLQLLDRSRTVHIAGHKKGPLSSAFQLACQLRGRRRLTGSLQAHHHQDRDAAAKLQLRRLASHQADQLFMDNLHHLLARRQAVHDVRAHGPLLHGLDKLLDHLEAYVRFQESHLDLL